MSDEICVTCDICLSAPPAFPPGCTPSSCLLSVVKQGWAQDFRRRKRNNSLPSRVPHKCQETVSSDYLHTYVYNIFIFCLAQCIIWYIDQPYVGFYARFSIRKQLLLIMYCECWSWIIEIMVVLCHYFFFFLISVFEEREPRLFKVGAKVISGKNAPLRLPLGCMLHLSRTTVVKGGQNEQLNYYIVLSDLQFLLRPMCSTKNPPNFQPLS